MTNLFPTLSAELDELTEKNEARWKREKQAEAQEDLTVEEPLILGELPGEVVLRFMDGISDEPCKGIPPNEFFGFGNDKSPAQ